LGQNEQLFKGSNITLNLNKILSSSCRRKILKTLSEKKGITIMKLVTIVNSTYNEVDRNLRILEGEGIINQRHVGRRRIIRLNLKNEKTLVTLKLLKLLNGAVDLKHLHSRLRRLAENAKKNGNCAKQ
jgi:DNA-binding transcriptional ArsR family regulator